MTSDTATMVKTETCSGLLTSCRTASRKSSAADGPAQSSEDRMNPPSYRMIVGRPERGLDKSTIRQRRHWTTRRCSRVLATRHVRASFVLSASCSTSTQSPPAKRPPAMLNAIWCLGGPSPFSEVSGEVRNRECRRQCARAAVWPMGCQLDEQSVDSGSRRTDHWRRRPWRASRGATPTTGTVDQ
jgi:hypothetical protein